jgi:predicted RNA-binding protein YlqC (UPF0109 family)
MIVKEFNEGVMNMKDLVKAIAESICDNPEDIKVTETSTSTSSIVELLVHPNDLGKMIGKDGKTAQAIRTIMFAASYNYKGENGKVKRYTLDIDKH